MHIPTRTTIAGEPAPLSLLELDPAICADALGREAFPLRHHLEDHPLLTLESLAGLADRLPVQTLECLSAEQEIVSPAGVPQALPKPSAVVLGIETNGRWMVMKNIEQDPLYRDLLDVVLDEMTSQLPKREGGMRLREAFIFLSAPAAVTPVHIDPEHNMLLHVRGTKQFQIGKFKDRLTELREIYRYQQGGHRNLDEVPGSFNCYELTPGTGLYVPPWMPHWVSNGSTYAISISVTFRTRRSERYEYTHMVNSKLQRLGLSPRPAGEVKWLDELKANYVRSKRRLRLLGRPGRSSKGYSA